MLRGTQGVKRCVRLPRWDTVLCKRSHWSRIQPLSHRWFLIKDIKALVCPFAVIRSRFGLRYSRVRGRRQSKFLASSSTGGARNFYPYTGEPRFALRKATVMRTKILSVTPLNPLGVTVPLMNKGSQEARSVAALRPLHRGAKKRTQFALQRTGSRGRSRAVHRFAAVALPLQNVPRPAAHLRFSCAGGALHTPEGVLHVPKARFIPPKGCFIPPKGCFIPPKGCFIPPKGCFMCRRHA